jgi:UDPglucose 6-dehydrogenase
MTLFYPDRVVVGSDISPVEHLYNLYKPILEQTFSPPNFLPRPEGLGAVPFITTDLTSAELIKYAANAFLALKISFINEVAQLAEKVGADVKPVAKGIGLDSRIGTRFLQAGIGWGGSCFGKDTSALISTANEYGISMPIVNAAREVNSLQRGRVVDVFK